MYLMLPTLQVFEWAAFTDNFFAFLFSDLVGFLDANSVPRCRVGQRDIDVSINYIKSTYGTMYRVLMKSHFSSDMIYFIFINAKFTINIKTYTLAYKKVQDIWIKLLWIYMYPIFRCDDVFKPKISKLYSIQSIGLLNFVFIQSHGICQWMFESLSSLLSLPWWMFSLIKDSKCQSRINKPS